jgi:hypothetical protein
MLKVAIRNANRKETIQYAMHYVKFENNKSFQQCAMKLKLYELHKSDGEILLLFSYGEMEANNQVELILLRNEFMTKSLGQAIVKEAFIAGKNGKAKYRCFCAY